MDKGDRENVTPLSSPPQWTRDRQPRGGVAPDVDGEDHLDDHFENNKTFLETETLCSRCGSLSHNSHQRHQEHNFHTQDCAHAHQAHAYAHTHAHTHLHPPPPPQPQPQPTAEVHTGDSIAGQSSDLGDESFLLSRQTSSATMAVTTTTRSAAVGATNNADPPPSSSPHSRWRQEPKVELRLSLELQPDDEHRTNLHLPPSFLDDLDHELLLPGNHLIALDRRLSSSRSRRRNRSPGPDHSKYLRVSSDGSSPSLVSRPSTIITREEFESLPPTIQRKYFSTIERSQFAAHHPDPDDYPRHGSAGHDQTWTPRPPLAKRPNRRRHPRNRAASDSPILSPRRRPRVTITDQRFYASLPEKIKRHHLTEEEQQVAHYRRQSLLLSAADEALIKIEKRESPDSKMPSPLASPGFSDGQSSVSSMRPPQAEKAGRESDSKRTDSFYDSFRWLEDDEGLDLRLFLGDYHINLRKKVLVPNKGRRPSFRRHLSINKLPFGHSSLSYSRPPTNDTVPTSTSPFQSPVPGSSGHLRRKSRALSLLSLNKQAMPIQSPAIDPAVAHYQDPEPRMKLRVYLASPQKLGEAIEFDFPSMDHRVQSHETNLAKGREGGLEGPDESGKFHSFLEDDQSSSYSDDVSIADSDSAKTTQMLEKSAPVRPVRPSTDSSTCLRGDGAREPVSCWEMTLRMTLTRPDIRASEEQIYGWKHVGGPNARQEPMTIPLIHARNGNPKESAERQLSALDSGTTKPLRKMVLSNGYGTEYGGHRRCISSAAPKQASFT